MILDPFLDWTVWLVKPFGRKSFLHEVNKVQTFCAYQIVESENHAIRLMIDGQLFSPEEISAFILREMRNLASAYVQEDIIYVVVTVPAQL